MRTCFCRRCGTPNEIEETDEKFFCVECGVENTVPKKRTEMAEQVPPVNSEPVAEPVTPVTENIYYTSPATPVSDSPYSAAPQTKAYTMNDYSATAEVKDKPKKKKKTGLIVSLSVIFVVLAASAVLLLAPIKSFLPIRFNCDECNKIKFSEKYRIEDGSGNETDELYICKDCFDKFGYEEIDD